MTNTEIRPGTFVRLGWQEMEHKGLVIAVTDAGVHVELNGPRARMVVMPPSMVEPV